AVPSGDVRIHYFRPDSNYSGWAIYTWNAHPTPGWCSGEVEITGTDRFGVYFDVPVDPTLSTDLVVIINNCPAGGLKDRGRDQHRDHRRQPDGADGRRYAVTRRADEESAVGPLCGPAGALQRGSRHDKAGAQRRDRAFRCRAKWHAAVCRGYSNRWRRRRPLLLPGQARSRVQRKFLPCENQVVGANRPVRVAADL